MKIEYEENKSEFCSLPFFSCFIYKDEEGGEHLGIRTGCYEAVFIEKKVQIDFHGDELVTPCEIKEVLLRKK